MSKIVFDTPGLIDIRAFTTMGMSAKPRSANPIGYFGTGLKYAVAVALRLGGSITVYVGRDRYDFYLQTTDFRGSEFQLVRMKRKRYSLTRATNHDLPFTTQYGRNWKWWQVFRELESNTRDENGSTYLIEDDEEAATDTDRTRIILGGEGAIEAYEQRGSVFLPADAPEHDAEFSNYFYWRGLRVYEFESPAMYTYNVGGYMCLTEDRTLYGDYQARTEVAKMVLASDDEQFIECVLTADEEFWEYSLQFPKDVAPGETFVRVARRCRPTIPFYSDYRGRWIEKEQRVRTFNPWEVHPLPWTNDDECIVDDNGDEVFVRPEDYDNEDWKHVAEAVCKRLERKSK